MKQHAEPARRKPTGCIFDFPLPRNQLDRGDHEEAQERCGDHAADHRGRDAAHDLGASAGLEHDREQAGDDGGDRHRVRAHAHDCALDDRRLEVGGVPLAARNS